MSHPPSDELSRAFYGDMSRPDRFWIRQAILQTVRRAAPLFKGVVLDLGCGAQPYRKILEAGSGRITRYIGMDLPDCIHGGPEVSWDGEKIPLPDASVDGVLATELFEHCPRPARVLSEINRVLKPDGMLVFTVPFFWPLHEVPHDEFRYTPFSLKRLLTEAGLADVNIAATGGWHASMAQMLGLWLVRAPMADADRRHFSAQLMPLWKKLIEADAAPREFSENTMATGWSGIVFKSGTRFRPTPLPTSAVKRLAIVRPAMDVYSETFIDDQITYLAEKPVVLHGHPYPIHLNPKETIVPQAAVEGLAKAAPEAAAAFLQKTFQGYLRRENVGVILAQYGKMGVAMIEAARALGIRLVVHFHGYDASKKEALGWLPALWRSDADIVVVSEPMRARLIGEGARPERIHKVPYGVGIPESDLAEPARSAPTLVAVGRFVEKKSPQSTLRAFARAAAAVPGSRLLMAGEGPLLAACQALAQELGIADRVEFLGVQPRPVVRRLFSSARAFVQHSVTAPDGDEEGLPVAILEAGAHGLPVISTRHAGIPEAVLDGETGLLVDEHDVEGMARAMEIVLRDPVRAGALGAAARERIASLYSRERSINALRSVLRID